MSRYGNAGETYSVDKSRGDPWYTPYSGVATGDQASTEGISHFQRY